MSSGTRSLPDLLERLIDNRQRDLDEAVERMQVAGKALAVARERAARRAPKRDALAIVLAFHDGRAEDVEEILDPYAGTDRRLVTSLAALCVGFGANDPEFGGELYELALRRAVRV